MIEGKTASGFMFSIEEDAFDDYELLEELREVDKGNTAKITDVVSLLLGPDGVKALKAHVRGEGTRVSARAMLNEVADIFRACNQGKNS